HQNALPGNKGRPLQALDELKQATQRDSTFALAYGELATAYARSAVPNFMDPELALPAGLKAADRAIALDPTLGAAYAAKGLILLQRRSYAEAESALVRAIELEPGYSWAHYYYTLLLMVEGRFQEARRENTITVQLDPLSGTPLVMRGVLYMLA